VSVGGICQCLASDIVMLMSMLSMWQGVALLQSTCHITATLQAMSCGFIWLTTVSTGDRTDHVTTESASVLEAV